MSKSAGEQSFRMTPAMRLSPRNSLKPLMVAAMEMNAPMGTDRTTGVSVEGICSCWLPCRPDRRQ
jgi:hypothetical protein